MPSDEDAFFDPAVRESQAALAERGYAFLAWLRSREEGEVAVGTHSAFLFALLNAAVVADDEPGTGLRAWFAAGELRLRWVRGGASCAAIYTVASRRAGRQGGRSAGL